MYLLSFAEIEPLFEIKTVCERFVISRLSNLTHKLAAEFSSATLLNTLSVRHNWIALHVLRLWSSSHPFTSLTVTYLPLQNLCKACWTIRPCILTRHNLNCSALWAFLTTYFGEVISNPMLWYQFVVKQNE